MKRLYAILMLFCCLGMARAVDQIDLLITVTNTPVTGDTLTINSTTRTWTNAHSSLTILTNLADFPTNTSTTNLYFNLSAYFLSELPFVKYESSNQLRLVFAPGDAVSASEAGNWASFSYETNDTTTARAVRMPITVEAATNQTNIATWLVESLQYSTAFIDGSWIAGSNLAALDLNNIFSGTNSLSDGGWNRASITNLTTLSGVLGKLTNGYVTNLVLDAPILTNGTLIGSVITNGTLAGTYAEIQGLIPYLYMSAEIGTESVGPTILMHKFDGLKSAPTAVENNDVLGHFSFGGYGSTAIKTSGRFYHKADQDFTDANASARFEFWLAPTNSTTLAEVVTIHNDRTTIANELRPTGTITNSATTGYGSFGVSGGPYGYPLLRRYNNTSLANGNNSGIVPGDAAYMKVSGPSASFTINGITNWADGRLLVIQNSTTHNMTIANDSGTDPQAGNRIYTGTGADVAITNNPGCVTLIYDSAVSRWVIVSKTD